MRLELDNELLFICSGAFILCLWFFIRYCHSRKVMRIASSLVGAFAMPALIPGHGEIVLILPNALLFTTSIPVVQVIGLFFLILNFGLLFTLLNWLSRKF